MNLLTSGSLFKRHPPQLCKTKNIKNNRFQKVFVQLLTNTEMVQMWNTSTIALYTSLSSSVAKMPWVIIPKNSKVRTTDISWLVQWQCVLCFVFSRRVTHRLISVNIIGFGNLPNMVRLKSKAVFKFKNNILKEEKQRINLFSIFSKSFYAL